MLPGNKKNSFAGNINFVDGNKQHVDGNMLPGNMLPGVNVF